jgi:hypothetical protein
LYAFSAVDAAAPMHRNVPNFDIDGLTASALLTFAERLLLAEGVEELL